MGTKHPGVDAYIAKSEDFAKPILRHLRALVHKTVPEVVEELKWSAPHFSYKGMLCGMASFKEHCSFGFWKGSLIIDKTDTGKGGVEGAAGNFGRITKRADLPSDRVLIGYLEEAKRLNDAGVKPTARPSPTGKQELVVPDYFLAAVKKNRKALQAFEAFSPSHRKEYVEWITGAKTDDTRDRRLASAVEWMAEGKPRNWKYLR